MFSKYKRNHSETGTNERFYQGLSASQKVAFVKAVDGESFFLTGSAGTGKSELLKRLVQYWTSIGHAFELTASTGIAALNINGKTLHSFAWIRPDETNSTVEAVLQRLNTIKAFKHRIKQLKGLQTLVIDEISMVHPDLFAMLSNLLQVIRISTSPFGGLQIICVGDFFQLPPVQSNQLLFETKLFQQVCTNVAELKECFRQKDSKFVELLSRVRTGCILPEDIAVLESRIGANIEHFGILPTELFSTNRDVDTLNDWKLKQLVGPQVDFEPVFGHYGIVHDNAIQKYKLECSTIKLKGPVQTDTSNVQSTSVSSTGLSSSGLSSSNTDCLTANNTLASNSCAPISQLNTASQTSKAHCDVSAGCQVMLTFNLSVEKGLVNGSRGIVLGFETPTRGITNLSSLQSLHSSEDIKVFVKSVAMPKVRFLVNKEPLDILIPYVKTTKTLNKDSYLFCWSIPLKLAWATTVHKSQGQSLDCIKVCLDKTVFADGQAYVALSRARTIEGLTLTAFDSSVIRANKKVIEYYTAKHCNV